MLATEEFNVAHHRGALNMNQFNVGKLADDLQTLVSDA